MTAAAVDCGAFALAGNPAVRALIVREVTTPELQSRFMHTRGTYPQVNGQGAELKAVNATIRRAVLVDERRVNSMIVAPPLFPNTKPGIYETSPRRALTSASSVVFSALVPTVTVGPGGGNGDWWLAVTVDTASARTVELSSLFVRPSEAFARLGSVAGVVLRRRACVRATFNRYALVPKERNFRFFALIPSGLAIGFPQGAAADVRCGRLEVTIPYAVVAPLLSSRGRRLVDGVRAPLG